MKNESLAGWGERVTPSDAKRGSYAILVSLVFILASLFCFFVLFLLCAFFLWFCFPFFLFLICVLFLFHLYLFFFFSLLVLLLLLVTSGWPHLLYSLPYKYTCAAAPFFLISFFHLFFSCAGKGNLFCMKFLKHFASSSPTTPAAPQQTPSRRLET